MNARRPDPSAPPEALRLVQQLMRAAFKADEGATTRSAEAAFGEAGLRRRSKSHVANLLSGDAEWTVPEMAVLLAHLAPDAIATGAAKLAGGTYVPSTATAPMPMPMRGLLIGGLTGDLLHGIADALRDGELDERERDDLRRIINDQIAQMQALATELAGGVHVVDDEAAARQTRPSGRSR